MEQTDEWQRGGGVGGGVTGTLHACMQSRVTGDAVAQAWEGWVRGEGVTGRKRGASRMLLTIKIHFKMTSIRK